MNLEQLLDQIGEAEQRENDQVSTETILELVGRRSFGSILLLVGLATLAPIIGDIPGVPTVLAAIVFFTGAQLLFNRQHVWLPKWLLRRSIKRENLHKVLKWSRRPARFVDRLLRPRLTYFAQGLATRVIALMCMVIAAATPIMELVPFSANGAGLALSAFGLALIARDGLIALIAFGFTATTIGVVIYSLV